MNINLSELELRTIEQKLDELNAIYGTEKRLCIFCDAEGYTGEKVLHEDECPIEKLRDTLRYITWKKCEVVKTQGKRKAYIRLKEGECDNE